MATQTLTDQSSNTTEGFEGVPDFPGDVAIAPLLRLSLEKLQQKDEAEIERFIRACEDLGFFYLDLSGPGKQLLDGASKLFQVGEALFDLPVEEKQKYDFMNQNSYFGYKGFGANIVDREGNKDRNEFYNVGWIDAAPHSGTFAVCHLDSCSFSLADATQQERCFANLPDRSPRMI